MLTLVQLQSGWGANQRVGFSRSTPWRFLAVRHRALGVLIATLCLSATLWSQTAASASVPIVVRIPGSISISLRSTPVTVTVQNGQQQQFEVPLTVQWNLDPRETPGFGVVAYFRSSDAALMESDSATAVPAGNILARWGEAQFRPFRGDATLTLFHTAVLPDMRRGTTSQTLQLKIADNLVAALPNGEYQGVLYLEVQNY